jgi:hypothetical protein
MKKQILNSMLSLAAVLSLSSCNSPISNIITFSGIAVDGYISGGTACLDLNSDGVCGASEPTVITSNDGTFTFKSIEVRNNQLIPVIVSGGIDTATGESFVGEMKNIIDSKDINSGEKLLVSPLTDLAATSYLTSDTKNITSLNTAKKKVAISFGINIDDVDSDPMVNSTLFAKTQEIQQTKKLIEVSLIKAFSDLSEEQIRDLRDQITQSYAKHMQDNDSPDLEAVFKELERTLDVLIPTNEKEFIVSRVKEVKVVLDELSLDTSADLNKLNDFQSKLEKTQEEAFQVIKDAQGKDTLNASPITFTKKYAVWGKFNWDDGSLLQ